MTDEDFMLRAMQLARMAEQAGEVPVGAVLVREGQIIGEGFNQPISDHDPSAHAEIRALQDAGRNQQNYRLPGSTLYVTLEPCPMCVGAMIHARVDRVVFAASDPKTGAMGGAYDFQTDIGPHNHQIEVTGGVLAEPASALLKRFFKQRRAASSTVKARAD